MIIGKCVYCKEEFRKRENSRKYCSIKCANQNNRNGLKQVIIPATSEELAEFIGICLGDGYAGKYQVTITLHSELDKEYIGYVASLAGFLFPGVTISIVKKQDKALDIRMSSKIAADFMKSQGIISRNKHIPTWLFSSPNYIKKCIRGLIDTDGSLIWHTYEVNSKVYKYPKISFTSHSKEILDFVFNGLKELGFNPKKTYTNQLWLHSQKDVKKYFDEIGVSNIKANIAKYYL